MLGVLKDFCSEEYAISTEYIELKFCFVSV